MTDDELVLFYLRKTMGNVDTVSIDPHVRDDQIWIHSFSHGVFNKAQHNTTTVVMSPRSYSEILFKEKKKLTFQQELKALLVQN